jgi:hypothetical protein
VITNAFENFNERHFLGEALVHNLIILKIILKHEVWLWKAFSWFRMQSSGRVL